MLLESYREMIMFYRDMVDHLKTLKNAEDACNTVVRAMQKFSYGKVSFAAEIDEFKSMIEAADTLDEIVTGFENAIIRAEEALGKAEGIDAKVIYMRDVERKRLSEIAEELGYSYDYVRKVSSRNAKRHN